MSLFYKQNAAARFFVDQTNGKVYEVVGGAAVLAERREEAREGGRAAARPRRAVGRRRSGLVAREAVVEKRRCGII